MRALLCLIAVLCAGTAAQAAKRCTPAISGTATPGGNVTIGPLAMGDSEAVQIRAVVTDADTSITENRLTVYTKVSVASTTDAYPDCTASAGVWTCKQLQLTWDSSTDGKEFYWVFPFTGPVFQGSMSWVGNNAGDSVFWAVAFCKTL